MATHTIPGDVLVAHLDEEAVVLKLGTKQYYRLNETGAAIWKGIEDGLDTEAIVTKLTETFDVAPDDARSELERVVDELRGNGLLDA